MLNYQETCNHGSASNGVELSLVLLSLHVSWVGRWARLDFDEDIQMVCISAELRGLDTRYLACIVVPCMLNTVADPVECMLLRILPC